MIRVLVANDLVAVRESWCVLLRRSSEISVVGRARDGYDAVELAQQLQPDVIVMDVEMPRLGGLQATRQIAGQQKAPMILLVLRSLDGVATPAAPPNGAWGCLSNRDLSGELVPAVLALQRRQPYFGKTIRERWPHLVNGPMYVDGGSAAHESADSSQAQATGHSDPANAEAQGIIDAARTLRRRSQTLRARAAKTRATSRQLLRPRHPHPPPAA